MLNTLLAPGAGVPSIVFRFASYFPLVKYKGLTEFSYELVQGHGILQQAPFNPHVLEAEYTAFKWGNFAFIWNLAICLFNFLGPNFLMPVLAAFDIAIFAKLASATIHQARYVPNSFGDCDGAETWQVSGNGTQSFFHVAGTLSDPVMSADGMCRHFVEEWEFGIISLGLQLLAGLLNIIAPIALSVYHHIKRRDADLRDLWQSFFKHIAAIPFFLCLALRHAGNRLYSRFIPPSTGPKLRYYLRYGIKWIQRIYIPLWHRRKNVFGPCEVELQQFPPGMCRPSAHPPALAALLHLDILAVVAQHSHYPDMVNLSLTSKTMREVIFPGGDSSRQYRMLRRYTCQDDSKAECWVCHCQICEGCDKSVTFDEAYLLSSHLETCKPYCDQCYYNVISSRRYPFPHCACGYKKLAMSESRLKSIYHGFTLRPTAEHQRRLCRYCSTFRSEWNIRTLRRMYEKAELKKMTGDFECRECRETISPRQGPRWWSCTTCNGECSSTLHPLWTEDGHQENNN